MSRFSGWAGDEALDFKPDPNAASPLYVQLAQSLAQAIRGGAFRPDEALPSERVLADQLKLSRVTARNAIDRLAEQGLIIRRRGSGSYVSPRLGQAPSRLTSFSEELHQRGFVPASRWLRRGFAAPAPDEQLSLDLGAGEQVARLERLRLADAVVMSYEVSVLPQSMLPDPHNVETSLYAHLGASAPVRVLQHIRMLPADAKLAGLLGVPLGAAVPHITRIGYGAAGEPVELTQAYCRSDYYDFVAEMRRD